MGVCLVEQNPQEPQDESEFAHPVMTAILTSTALLELQRFYVAQGRHEEADWCRLRPE